MSNWDKGDIMDGFKRPVHANFDILLWLCDIEGNSLLLILYFISLFSFFIFIYESTSVRLFITEQDNILNCSF